MLSDKANELGVPSRLEVVMSEYRSFVRYCSSLSTGCLELATRAVGDKI